LISTKADIKSSSQAGFTLIEILVAITILSFMMVSIYTIVDNNIRTKESVVTEDREFLQMYTAMHRIKEDISQMYNPLYYSSTEIQSQNNRNNNQGSFGGGGFGGSGSDSLAFNNRFVPSRLFPKANVKNQPIPLVDQLDKSTLMFMTASNKRFIEGQKQSRFSWVEYSLVSDDRENAPADNMLVRRVLSENVFERDFDIKALKPQVLLRGVKDILWEFWSRNDLKWVDNIRLLPPEERETIRAVRLTLTFVDTAGVERTTLRVFRPLWPYFDAVKDETERQAARNNRGGQQRGNNQGGNNQGGNQQGNLGGGGSP
jgi:prepilin-type N-terminal cleavage/methylation domain-containing protein